MHMNKLKDSGLTGDAIERGSRFAQGVNLSKNPIIKNAYNLKN